MTQQQHIERKSEETLSSLDGIQRAAPAPYFFTRLQARLQEKISIWENISAFINKPGMAFATISFVLVLNAFAFLKQPSQSSEVTTTSAIELSEQNINNVYDFASKTNNTLQTIWNENEQPVKK